jgi:hypothetical protein
MNAVMKTWVWVGLALLLMACSSERTPDRAAPTLTTQARQNAPTIPSPTSPPQHAVSTRYTITEQDNGQVFTYRPTSRFTVELDDSIHPRSQLQCLPEPIIGYISNGSSGGSGYPIRYEVGREGTCDLVSGDFRVTIIGAY